MKTEANVPRPGRQRSEAVRVALLEAAHTLVRERGYENVTISDIADAAGAGRQTIYRWWPGKAHLVLDALEECGAARKGLGLEMASPSLPVFFRRVCQAATDAATALRSLMGAAQADPELRRLLFERLIDRRRQALDAVLDAAGVKSQARREALVLALYGAVWYRLLLDEPLDDAFAEKMLELAKKGMSK